MSTVAVVNLVYISKAPSSGLQSFSSTISVIYVLVYESSHNSYGLTFKIEYEITRYIMCHLTFIT